MRSVIVKKLTPPLIRIDTTNEMHLLQHYRVCPEKRLQYLLHKKYEYCDPGKKKFVCGIVTKRAIKKALRTKGKSRFFINIPGIETPGKMIALVKREVKKRTLCWHDVGGGLTASFTFTYPIFVGDDIPERSTRKTKRIGVELNWIKDSNYMYMTAYPHCRSRRI